MKINTTIQYCGSEVTVKELESAVKEQIKASGVKSKDIKEIHIYHKPEEGKTYFVAMMVNGEIRGEIA